MMRSRTIQVYLYGGIGNMLFQISLAKYLSEHKSSKIKFMIVSSEHKSDFTLNLNSLNFSKIDLEFCENLRVILLKLKLMSLLPKSHVYINLQTRLLTLKILKNIHAKIYFGYFQNLELAEFARTDLKQLFATYRFSPWFNSMRLKMESDNPIAIHVRRGDYLSTKSFHGLLSEDYYSRAINLFPSNAKFWVFSDDIEFAKQLLVNLEVSRKIYFVTPSEEIDPMESLMLFSLSESQIIANSTFSWWGAFLSKGAGTTIFPRQWFFSESAFQFETPKSWKGIDSSWDS